MSYGYHRLMNELIEVLRREFQIELNEIVIHVLLVVLMDSIPNILKQDPIGEDFLFKYLQNKKKDLTEPFDQDFQVIV